MHTFPLPIRGPLNVAYATLVTDPQLIVKKFPAVVSIERLKADEYYITTLPMAITNSFGVQKKIVVAYVITEEGLTFKAPTDASLYPRIDGWLEGNIRPMDSGASSKLDIVIRLVIDPSNFGAVDAHLENAVGMVSMDLYHAITALFRATGFSNAIPPAPIGG